MTDGNSALIVLSVLTGYFVIQTFAETCNMSGPCSCDFNHWKLDLSPLVASMNNFQPTFTDISGKFIFNYNPCKPFQSNASNCKNDTDLAVNRIDNNGNCLVIGNQTSVVFKGDTSNVDGIYLEYTYEKLVPKSVAKVFLKCNNQQNFKFVKQESLNPPIFTFRLETVYACQPVNHKLSVGSVLIILVTLAATIYLIGGFIFKHFYLNAQGVEIIPHYSFWSDFPLLVRDGCYFAVRGCQGPSTYERI